MKRIILKMSVAAALLSFSVSALAWQDTAYFQIGQLAASSASMNGFRVYPKDYALPTAQGCTHSDFAEMDGLAMNYVEAEMMGNTLLAAFLAGRKVKLRLDGCGSNGRPQYRVISVDSRY